MKESLKNIEGYENFRNECTFFKCSTEYPGWTGEDGYFIITALSQNELQEKYPEMLKAMQPCFLVTDSMKEAWRRYYRNEQKYLWRAKNRDVNYEMVEKMATGNESMVNCHQEDEIEQHLMIESALDFLTEKQRQRVVLYYFGGYTHREIAEMEGIKRQVVERSVQSALKKINFYFNGGAFCPFPLVNK